MEIDYNLGGYVADNLYKDDSIESLSPREHVRLRPGVYAGDTSNPNQLLLEIFSNALDEHNIGHGEKIAVNISKNGQVDVEDNGQGFPINVMREDGCTVLEAAFSVMNTSGKFSEDGVYEGTSLGLNGMGSKLTNFLSKWFEVISWQKGKYEHLWFKDGEFEKREVGDWTDKSSPSGTWVKYMPDKQFFDTIHTNEKFFNDFFNDICCLCPKLTVVYSSEGKAVKISHPRGIEDLIERRIGNAIELVDNRLIISDEVNGSKLDLALSFTGNNSSTIIPYVNFGLTNIGPHITGIKSTITRVINNWAKENNILKKSDKNLEGSAIQEGMLLVCNIVTTNVAYNAQVKTTVTKIDSSFVNTMLAQQLELWLDQNPTDAKKILEKAIMARKAAEAAKKAREAVRAKATVQKKEKVFKLPTTLSDSWSKDRSKCELLICEGKSAAGGLVDARNSEFQAVYGVRGKMLSVLKTTPDKIVKNQEINNLLQALGLDYDPKNGKCVYNKNKLRYGKIIACADADPDGKAIENLLFNILWYICPDLIIEGHVYSAVPPLYRITTSKNEYIYLKDDEELEKYKEEHKGQKFTIGRNKGLGEQDPEELSYCLLEPETRNILQLVVNDIGKTDMTFKDLYGRAVTPRVNFLNKHLEEVRWPDLPID